MSPGGPIPEHMDRDKSRGEFREEDEILGEAVVPSLRGTV